MKTQRSIHNAYLVSIIAGVLTIGSSSHAAIIHVPADQPTIQAGIDAANPGDEVVIADGTYTGAGNKNLDYGGKAITVRSASGNPAACIIDCENNGRGVYFHSNEGNDSILEGLTIRNGSVDSSSAGGYRAEHGGGILCENASPAITKCILQNNSATRNGGGLYCHNYCNPLVTDCIFTENSAGWHGGGMYCNNSEYFMTNCVFSENQAQWDGGGLYLQSGGYSRFTNCIFGGNTASSDGGGIFNDDSFIRLSNCLFTSNSANDNGGGMYNVGYSVEIFNTVFNNNSAQNNGNAIFNTELETCHPVIQNSILWGENPQVIYNDLEEGERVDSVVSYSLIQGGQGQDYIHTGCIFGNPLFVDADGPDDNPDTWRDNDYRLSANSPCIDKGSNSSLAADELDLDGDGDTIEPIPFDLEGRSRFVDDPNVEDQDSAPNIDMGAYEYQPDPGDLDWDGDIDLNDFALFVECLVGPDVTDVPAGVDPELFQRADLDYDGDVDLKDFYIFQMEF